MRICIYIYIYKYILRYIHSCTWNFPSYRPSPQHGSASPLAARLCEQGIEAAEHRAPYGRSKHLPIHTQIKVPDSEPNFYHLEALRTKSADPCRQQGERVREEITSNIVGSESKVRQWGPWPAGPVRPSGPCSFGVAKAPFVKLTASFLVGSESNVRQWGPWPARLVRPSGPCSCGGAKAPFVKLLATGRQLRQLVFL